ncbi:MAG: hypothetical protein CL407_10255 [Acidimicrobiaceae bacterium]|nr:hypothetical protein [Acidimicrobiaceae bacterium]HAQ44507.1 hypothetical protein [Acidimicrobiaceae bacterium]
MTRIAINLLWLRPGQVGGSETYAIRLLKAISKNQNFPPIEIFASAATIDRYPFLETDFTINRHNPTLGRGGRIWLENRLFADLQGAEVAHHLGGTIPKHQQNDQALVTIYDIQYRDYPQNFSGIKRRYLDKAIQRALNDTHTVCVMSEFTARCLEEHFGYPKERCHIVPPAIEAAVALETCERKTENYLLYPAVTWAHKEHKFLIKVIEQLKDLDLIFVGGQGPLHNEVMKAIKSSPAADRITHLGNVDEEKLDRLYRHALCTTFPSQYEGFGQPVIEAMTRGCPVISSTGGALPDTVGAGGITIPTELDQWIEAVNTIRQPDIRQQWIEHGFKRASNFSNNQTATAQLAVYNALLQQ